eukprot:tig00000459_g1143.t1
MAGSAVLILVILLLVVGVGAAFLLMGSSSDTGKTAHPLEGKWYNPTHEATLPGGVKGMARPHVIRYSRTTKDGEDVYRLTIPDYPGWNKDQPLIITVDGEDPESMTISNWDGDEANKKKGRYIPDTDSINYDPTHPNALWIRKKAYQEKYNV